MALTIENGDKFRKALADKKMTQGDLHIAIATYVEKKIHAVSQRVTAAHNLRKELSRGVMSDKVLAKGLKIIGA